MFKEDSSEIQFQTFKSSSDIKLRRKPRRNPLLAAGEAKPDPEDVIDAFEQANGLKPKKREKLKFTYNHGIFSPKDVDDQIRLNELMNHQEKYKIVKWSENWDKMGNLNIFVVYAVIEKDTNNE